MPVTYSPAKILEQFLKTDPVTSRILLAGLSVIAATSIVTSWNIDIKTAGLAGIYIFLIGFTVVFMSNALKDGILQKITTIFFIVILFIFILLFGFSAFVRNQGIIKPPYCIVEFWKNCDTLEKQLTEENSKALDAEVTVPAVITPAASVDASKFTVFIQFAGLITRESVTSLNQSLLNGKWKAQGGSGERTQAAAGYNEVRYGIEADKAAAQALADQVSATNISSRKLTAKLVPVIKPGTLEIWMSK